MNNINFKVLITWRLLIDDIDKYLPKFKEKNISIDILKSPQHTKEEKLINIIHKYDGIICGDDEITKKVINKAKKLKIISKWGTGIDSIDVEYLKKKNIKLFNTPGAFTKAVAQHALGLMLAITRNITLNHIDLLRNDWSKRICTSIENQNIGIVGYGKIGKEIHRLLKAFRPNFYFNDKKKINFKNTKLTNLLKTSDIVFICCNLNKTSKHLIKLKELRLMKKNSIIINISRGPIIKNDDLIKALKNNVISFAALDVYENEPIDKNSQFLKLNNCILTSHNAFNTKSHIENINTRSVNNLINNLK
jgi:D-3-phosphoglycerate dehydrogenase